jgi:hypothetical protein
MVNMHRARNAAIALVCLAIMIVGTASAVEQTPAAGREPHSVTIPAAEAPPAAYPTATPVVEEPENRIVVLFRSVLIAGMLVMVGLVVAGVLLVRGVKRRRSGR